MASTNSSATTFYNSLPPSQRSLYKQYARTVNKLCAQRSRKEFLRQCRRHGVRPAHIQNTFRCTHGLLEDASPYRNKLEKAMEQFTRTILNTEIKDSYYKIQQLERAMSILTSQITQVTPSHIYTTFFQHQESFSKKHERLSKVRTERKIQRLLERVEIENTINFTPNDAWIRNTTNVEVPNETKILLGYGPKFALPVENNQEIPYFKIIADLESILKLEPDPILQAAHRNQFTNILQNYVNKRKGTHFNTTSKYVDHFMIEALNTSKKFIRDHPDVYIVPADKGNKTVIMMRDEYEEKMQTLVSDVNTYERIDTDWTNKIQAQNNKLVNKLFNHKMIDQQTRSRLVSYHATCPKIYGLPKIHKPDSPLRVILSCINCPTYDLSKYLADILRHSIDQTKYNVQNSYEFCTFINNVTLPPGYVLVSFDVVSLFTCIPRDIAIEAVRNNWSLIEKNTTIKNVDMFVELINFNLSSSYFVHRGSFYRQKAGTAMGNPLSPALADLVMETLLDHVLGAIDIPIPFLKKFVDDLITALPIEKIEHVKNSLNGFNPHIQFTCEIEENNKLAYLDMLLIRTEQQTITTDWYKKPVASGRILNYFSFHPLTQKLNTATGFIGRVFRLSTCRSENEKKDLLNNNYPSALINRLVNRFINRSTNVPNDSGNTNPEPKTYRSLHHVDNLTPALAKVIKRNFPSITLSFKCVKTNRLLFSKLKDKTPQLEQRNVIYRIPCIDCDASYIGLTTQQLKNRLSGHRSLINRYTELKSSDPLEANEREEEFKKTALMVHAIENDHRFDLSKTKIVEQDNRLQALQILEMCHIFCDNTTVNFRTDTSNLNVVYSGFLHSIADEGR
ncbi:uncharacterized protein LOC134290776 [Aedes albopictus]|uniref:Reverse transcriptase domain-containing protein n=1 Tax=Aedes albopictus TaxID=7160 RepID=A0ABM1ZYU6_AEDAL